MRKSVGTRTLITPLLLLLLIAAPAAFASSSVSHISVTVDKSSSLGTIKGIVRDDTGGPIADAVVGIFKGGTTTLLKQVTSTSDGRFLARIMPGTYTVLAVAAGFNPVRLLGVEVGRSAEVSYGFSLERAGSGNTLPEKRADRNSSKWRIRAAQMQRSIYQNRPGEAPVTKTSTDDDSEADLESDPGSRRRGQGVVETYFASGQRGNYGGLNFATLVPVSGDAEIFFAGQTGLGRNVPQRFETGAKYRPSADHQFTLTAAIAKPGLFGGADHERPLGQASLQTLDEWKLKEGVILVFGFDYSRFFGGGTDSSLAPRLGLQFDLDQKTRIRSAFTTQTESKSWANAIEIEGHPFAFTEPTAMEDIYVVNGRARMDKSRRLELGVERLINDHSSVDANFFLDTTLSRGVGLNKFSFDALDNDTFEHFVANQQGQTHGFRLIYNNRISDVFSSTVGYTLGQGQSLSPRAAHEPSQVFESDFFQSFFAQLAADLKTGTSVKTIFRLSPKATVFAIDPFKGRLAIYDPGLSVYLTQSLPTWGLPLRAQAVVDARNLFDFQSGLFGEEGGLRLSGQRRMVRGGLQVRF